MTTNSSKIRDVVIENFYYNDIKLKVGRFGVSMSLNNTCGGVEVSACTVLISDKCLNFCCGKGTTDAPGLAKVPIYT